MTDGIWKVRRIHKEIRIKQGKQCWYNISRRKILKISLNLLPAVSNTTSRTESISNATELKKTLTICATSNPKLKTRLEWLERTWCTKTKTQTTTFLFRFLRDLKYSNDRLRKLKKCRSLKPNNPDPVQRPLNSSIRKETPNRLRSKLTKDKVKGNKKSCKSCWTHLSWGSFVTITIKNWSNRARLKVSPVRFPLLSKTTGKFNKITVRR